MKDKLKKILIHKQPSGDGYYVMEVWLFGAVHVNASYNTIGEAARSSLDKNVPIYDLTANRAVTVVSNLITREMAESGKLG
jgi:hypothetical protein